MNMFRQRIAAGDEKVMGWLNTGGGKSIIFREIIRGLNQNNKNVLLVMRRRELVFQGVDHVKAIGHTPSILMGTTKGYDTKNSVQVCSIDTVVRREIDYNFFDYIIIDECHDCVSDSYKKFLDKFTNNQIFIGLTATPFMIGNKVHSFWDSVVKPIESHELRDLGFLVDADVFAPASINTSGIKIQGGDFNKKELFERASKLEIIGDIVDTYKKYGENKRAILFAVNIQHSEILCAAFNRSGIPAIHCDQSHDINFRKKAINKLKSGEIKILCNVNIFSTGVDIPQAEIGIMARPTRSEVLYIQQLGRLLRPFKKCLKCRTERGAEGKCHVCGSLELEYEKSKAIILDHGNNTDAHGMPFDVRDAVLSEDDKKAKKKKELNEEKEPITKVCKSCFFYNPSGVTHCKSCGEPFKKSNAEINEVGGELTRIDPKTALLDRMKRRLAYYETLGRQYNWKPTAKYFKMHTEFKDKIFQFNDELELPRWLESVVQKTSDPIEKDGSTTTKVYT